MQEENIVISEVKNVSRYISSDTTKVLWAMTAGRCEFKGCNQILFKHHVTGDHGNFAETAHIYAFSEGGTRHSPYTGSKINDIGNLLLVCDRCHKLIDKPSNESVYTADVLKEYKRSHETRIRIVTDIIEDLKTTIISYSSKIGSKDIRIPYDAMSLAVIPDKYPESDSYLSINPDISVSDDDPRYWEIYSDHMEEKLHKYIQSRKTDHISLFAVAPQPLLFKLGTILNRNFNVSVRQPQSSIGDWKWSTDNKAIEILTEICAVDGTSAAVALVVDFSARIDSTVINSIVGMMPIYRISIAQPNPKCIHSVQDIAEFVKHYRETLNRIRANHSGILQLHLFAASPVSIVVEMGRHWMEKGDPQVLFYDRNPIRDGFHRTMVFGRLT